MKNYFYDEAAKTISSIKENSGKEDYCFALLTDTKLYDTGDDTRENISMQLLSTELDMYKKSISSKKLYVTPGMHDGYRDESFVGQLAEDIISDDIWYDFFSFHTKIPL